MLSPELQKSLQDLHLDPAYVEDLAKRTIAEDLDGGEDLTTVSTIPASHTSIAEFRARKAGTVAGVVVAAAVLEVCGITDYEIDLRDGSHVEEGQKILTARGETQKLLLAERTALNFMGRLSGIATLTHRWVMDIKGTNAKIRDTRKTTPLLRELEKFAVRMGGGVNHRMSLSDAALIKDNHIVAAGGIKEAVEAVRAKYPDLPIEVEVDTLEQLAEIVDSAADLVLLDNMNLEQTRAAVAIAAGRLKLESSGGLTLENAGAYAATGVDYLAVGALTHSAPVLDIGLDLKNGK
ncbi:MAG: carboxylating nicotinate-nucleotide diphosphorylase [Actinomycetes bacterium]